MFYLIELMFSRVLGDPEEIPVPPNRRSNTDCLCTVITSVFAIAMLVLAIIAYANNGIDSTSQDPTTAITSISRSPSSLTTPATSLVTISMVSRLYSSGRLSCL